jgi:quinolinate synthase
MNSSAAIKAFTGRHGGTICTSSNARTALEWAFEQTGGSTAPGRCCSCPTSTWVATRLRPRPRVCRWTTASSTTRTAPWAGSPLSSLRAATMILWRGHCSVHGRFTVDAVEAARRDDPRRQGDRAPRVPYEVCEAADVIGSTEQIIKTIAAAPAGTAWVVGTELNLVKRLADHVPRAVDRLPREERLLLLDDEPHRPAAPRVDPGVLVEGRVVNPIRVDPEIAHWARVALDQMLALPGPTHKD